MIRVVFAEIPASINGTATCDSRWNKPEYLIIINKDLSMDKKISTFRHELLHIIYKDFELIDKGVSAEEIERLNRERMRVLYNE